MRSTGRTAGAASAPSTASGAASPLPIAPAACHAPFAGRTDVLGGSVADGCKQAGHNAERQQMTWSQALRAVASVMLPATHQASAEQAGRGTYAAEASSDPQRMATLHAINEAHVASVHD